MTCACWYERFGSAGKPGRLVAVAGLRRERSSGRVRILRTVQEGSRGGMVRRMRTLRLLLHGVQEMETGADMEVEVLVGPPDQEL